MNTQRLFRYSVGVSFLLAGFAQGATFSYSDFSSVAGLTLNGDAAQAGSVLRVAPSVDSAAGSAYYSTAVAMGAGASFSTSFEFNVTSDPSSGFGATDGFTFILQNSGVNALGDAGQGSGYVGITPSVAVLFRGRETSFIGVVENGVDPLLDVMHPYPAASTPRTEGDFYGGNRYAWIDYDAATTKLSVYLGTTSTKPGTAELTTTIDIGSILGPQAFVGFTAGTGAAYGSNDILNWNFDSAAVVPETSTYVFGGLALLPLLAAGVKRRVAAK